METGSRDLVARRSRRSSWQAVDHRIELVVLESEDPGEVVVKRVDQGAEDLAIPLGEFRGPVVGDPEGSRLGRVEVGPHDCDLLPSQASSRLERSVAGDDDSSRVEDDRLLLAERLEGVDDRLEVPLAMLPGVRGIRRRLVDRDNLGLHPCLLGLAESRLPRPRRQGAGGNGVGS